MAEIDYSKHIIRENVAAEAREALAEGEADGVVKLVYDPADGRLLGCHVLGAHAADLVAEAALAIASCLSCSDFRATVHAHPTLSELLVAAAEGCNA